MTTTADLLVPPARRWRREGVVLATTFAICLLGGAIHVDDRWGAPPAAAYLIAVISCVALPLRERRPVVTVLVTAVCGAAVAPLGLLLTPLIVAPAVVAAYALGRRVRRRTTIQVLYPSAALMIMATVVAGDLSWQDASRLGIVVAFPLVAALLGHAAQDRRAYLAAVEERAQRAEQDRENEARRRVDEERVRMARELHDLVAHQITLANAQATVAAHVFDAQPDRARRSLDDLVETTAQALDDLRATVGLLRQQGEAASSVEPAPGLDRLPALVESFRRAGLEVTVEHDGPPRPLPPGVDLTAFRIIQEALTNVTKHAGAGTARVGLFWARDLLGITVSDDGRPSGTPSPVTRAPGHGLIGMRERAAAVGGHLSAGRRPEGGFKVATHLPLPPVRARSDVARVEEAR
ncbi:MULTISPECIES: sensor histidine kinase [unclassified Nocardioides]|uniref:sensor histidine kinase n=1 Tax=unclassified Nocardioides TaxID=2615069 RepID=UPI0030155E88